MTERCTSCGAFVAVRYRIDGGRICRACLRARIREDIIWSRINRNLDQYNREIRRRTK